MYIPDEIKDQQTLFVKKLAKERRVTKAEIAEVLGCSVHAVHMKFYGNSSFSTVEFNQLLDHFNNIKPLSADELSQKPDYEPNPVIDASSAIALPKSGRGAHVNWHLARAHADFIQLLADNRGLTQKDIAYALKISEPTTSHKLRATETRFSAQDMETLLEFFDNKQTISDDEWRRFDAEKEAIAQLYTERALQDDVQNLRDFIGLALQARDMNQAELARSMGISSASLSSFCSEKPALSRKSTAKLAKEMDFSDAELAKFNALVSRVFGKFYRVDPSDLEASTGQSR